MEQKNLGNLIWSVAELLRGDFKKPEYGLVILPFIVLRRFEYVLELTRQAVYVPPRSLEEIDADLDKVSREIMELLQEVHV